MRSFIHFFLLSFITLFLLFPVTHLQSAENVPDAPVKLALQSFSLDNKIYLAVSFENLPGWHTYWRNPGDAGLALKNQFILDKKEIKLNEEEWPSPKRFIENGTQWAYGYVGSYTLFYKIEKSDLNKLTGKSIVMNASWLVCKNICIPGHKEIPFKIKAQKIVSESTDLLPPLSDLELSSRFMNLPKASAFPDYLEIKLLKGLKEKTLVLTYEVRKTTDASFLKDANLLYSYPSPPFDFQHENLTVKEASLEGIVEINWDGEYSTPVEILPANGKFIKPHLIKFLFNDPVQRKVVVIEKKFTSFELTGSSRPIAINSQNESTPGSKEASAASEVVEKPLIQNPKTSVNSLFYYLIVAFLGGLILNIMPCVLPVISLKLFGLVKYRNESRKVILRHNFFYTLGILFTFIAFGCIVLGLKSLGTQVGWGFQLQSPNFIAIMIIALFIFSLNLLGLFEFITPGGKHLGNIQTEEGFVGDFLSGVLATILSTPCSAPFLGTALTFAFTSSPMDIFLVFISIGLGLAFPFIMTGFFPQLVTFLPRPGQWMNNVKKFLGFTLILTLIWLFDVYNALVDGSSQLVKLACTLVFIFGGISFLKKEKWMGAVSFLIALGLFVNLSSTTLISSQDDQTALIRDKKARGLNWEAWSNEKMREYKEDKQTVFIDFTAKWCFTCKINERLVLDTKEFKQFALENNLKLLIGDWTKRDEVIGSFLRQNALVGVPAYFIQKSDGTLIGLGETVTIQRIKDNLK
jgi:thiol:disulfide interchange protein/DsbC/DsbD-like thiol-disulfide interchange protein